MSVNFNAHTPLLEGGGGVRLSDETQTQHKYNFNADTPLLEKLNTKQVAV